MHNPPPPPPPLPPCCASPHTQPTAAIVCLKEHTVCLSFLLSIGLGAWTPFMLCAFDKMMYMAAAGAHLSQAPDQSGCDCASIHMCVCVRVTHVSGVRIETFSDCQLQQQQQQPAWSENVSSELCQTCHVSHGGRRRNSVLPCSFHTNWMLCA